MASPSAAVFCLVVGISEVDTVKVGCGKAAEEKVRLLQIEAREKKQAFGSKAKEALSDLAFQKQVQLERGGTDRYGPTLGRLSIDGTDLSARCGRVAREAVGADGRLDGDLCACVVAGRQANIGAPINLAPTLAVPFLGVTLGAPAPPLRG